MSEERELALLTEIRTMLAMDKTKLAETYQISIDSADDYRNTKAKVLLHKIEPLMR